MFSFPGTSFSLFSARIIPFIFPRSIPVQSINYYNFSFHLSDRAPLCGGCFIFRCSKYFFTQTEVHLSRGNGIDTRNFYMGLQTHGAPVFAAWDKGRKIIRLPRSVFSLTFILDSLQSEQGNKTKFFETPGRKTRPIA